MLAALGTSASASRPSRAADAVTLRMSLTSGFPAPTNIAAAQWAQAVMRRANGRLKIEIYPNAQLVKEREAATGLVSGIVDLVVQASIFLEPLFPRIAALSLPFLFKDSASAYRIADGPIGEELFADFESKGIVGLSWPSSGFRELETVGKIVRTPNDTRGLRLRIQGGAVNLAMASALGSIPITIDFSEVFTALQQHTVDAMETTPEGLIASKLYTVLGHIALTNHVFNFTPLLVGKSKLEPLPRDLQQILRTRRELSASSGGHGSRKQTRRPSRSARRTGSRRPRSIMPPSARRWSRFT